MDAVKRKEQQRAWSPPMKYFLVAVIGIAGLVSLHAVPQTGSDVRARELIRTLKLSVLPKESGYLGIIGRSRQTVTVDGRTLAVQSQNYYMLTRDLPINYLLGMDLAAGQRPVVAVPGGCWKALRLHDGVSYALMVNTLSPEFTSDRVKIGAGAGWVKRYANSAPWATPEALRELIGPNWTAQ